VSFNKLSESPAGGSLTEPPLGGQRYTPHDDQQNGQRKPKPPHAAEPSTGPPPRFKLGDRVVIFNKDGIGIHGTVRWAGKYGLRDEKKKYHSFSAVGIETDIIVHSNDFESYLPPSMYAFTVGKGKGQVFVRDEEAMLEADYDVPDTPAEKPPVQPQQPKAHGGQPAGPPSAGTPPQKPPQSGVLNISDPLTLAQQMRVGHTQLEQSEILQQAAENSRKKAKELNELGLESQ